MRMCGLWPVSPPDYRVAMDVLRVGPRQLDYGNMVGGFKPLLDVLVRVHLLRDDSPEWLSDVYTQQIGRPARLQITFSRARKVT